MEKIKEIRIRNVKLEDCKICYKLGKVPELKTPIRHYPPLQWFGEIAYGYANNSKTVRFFLKNRYNKESMVVEFNKKLK